MKQPIILWTDAGPAGAAPPKSPATAPGRGVGEGSDESPSPPGQRTLTSPEDPDQIGLGDPVQPVRPAPMQPSRVVEPSIGAAGPVGDGDAPVSPSA